jgi:hypothetical protein
MNIGARETPTPDPSPQGGGEFAPRASLLPPPLRGRVGEGGSPAYRAQLSSEAHK